VAVVIRPGAIVATTSTSLRSPAVAAGLLRTTDAVEMALVGSLRPTIRPPVSTVASKEEQRFRPPSVSSPRGDNLLSRPATAVRH